MHLREGTQTSTTHCAACLESENWGSTGREKTQGSVSLGSKKKIFATEWRGLTPSSDLIKDGRTRLGAKTEVDFVENSVRGRVEEGQKKNEGSRSLQNRCRGVTKAPWPLSTHIRDALRKTS